MGNSLKDERNEEIVRLHESGQSFSELAKKYNLSETMIRHIVISSKEKEEKENKLLNDPLFLAMNETANELDLKYNVLMRTYNAISRKDIDTVSKLLDCDNYELSCITNVGKQSMKLLIKTKETIKDSKL